MGGYVILDPEAISLSNLYVYLIGGDGGEWSLVSDGTVWVEQRLGGLSISNAEVVPN